MVMGKKWHIWFRMPCKDIQTDHWVCWVRTWKLQPDSQDVHRGVLNVLFSCFSRFSSAACVVTVPQPVPEEQLPTRKHRLSSDCMAGKCNTAMRCNLRSWKGTETNRYEEKAFKKAYIGKQQLKKNLALHFYMV